MTKSIKTLAVLGVVAGLGIAALPLNAQAAETTVIDGVAPEGAADASNYDGTADGRVSTDATIQLELADKLSITTDQNNVALTPETAGSYSGKYTGNAVNVTVRTRNSKGYQLTMVGSAGAEQNNATVVNALTNEKGDTITAGDLTGATSTWGYTVATNILGTETAAGSTYKGVAAADGADAVIMTSDKATKEDGDKATLNFGANIVDGQAAGIYKGKVTFTASNLPLPTTGD